MVPDIRAFAEDAAQVRYSKRNESDWTTDGYRTCHKEHDRQKHKGFSHIRELCFTVEWTAKVIKIRKLCSFQFALNNYLLDSNEIEVINEMQEWRKICKSKVIAGNKHYNDASWYHLCTFPFILSHLSWIN